MGDEASAYDKGQMIFCQGDPGGDLYLIKDGEVEIFTVFDGHEVPLAVMKAGEILGTLTLLTKEPRMASARARTSALIQHVPQKNIMNLMQNLPKWMHIVLKDFTSRLKGMNERYGQILHRLKDAQASQINIVDISAQLALVIAGCAEFRQKLFDDVPGLLPNEILDFAETLLFRERADLEKAMQAFIDSGMITLRVEQEHKRKYFTVEAAKNIKGYADFIREAQRKKIKNLLQTKFRNKELRTISALIRYVQAKKMDLTKSIKLKVTQLEVTLEKTTGQAFELTALEHAQTLKLIQLEGEGENRTLIFDARNLSRTLAHLSAYHKLNNIID